MDANELGEAILGKGYDKISFPTVNLIVHRYSVNGGLTFDDYINFSTRIRALSIDFKQKMKKQSGKSTMDGELEIKYQPFVVSAIKV